MDKDTFFHKKQLLRLKGKIVDLRIPKVMGILNITPDSFYDGGSYLDAERIKKRVNEMLSQGADIIDVGAYSSRPNAKNISEVEELERLTMALKLIRQEHAEIYISVDTFRSAIAKTVVNDFEVDMINDISGGTLDKGMPETIANLQVPYVLMHMPGTPQNMQSNTTYKDVVRDIISYFGEQTQLLKSLGVNDIIVDPGFGFGKTLEQNYKLLHELEAFGLLELPVLVGISRKSMIYKLLNTGPEHALNGTTALHMMALERGADILRVHDVQQAKETITLFTKVMHTGLG